MCAMKFQNLTSHVTAQYVSMAILMKYGVDWTNPMIINIMRKKLNFGYQTCYHKAIIMVRKV